MVRCESLRALPVGAPNSLPVDTSLTNFLAFMLGSLTSLPAVEYFCLYAGTAILFDFILQVMSASDAKTCEQGCRKTRA